MKIANRSSQRKPEKNNIDFSGYTILVKIMNLLSYKVHVAPITVIIYLCTANSNIWVSVLLTKQATDTILVPGSAKVGP